MPEPRHILDEYAGRIRADLEANLLQQEQLRSELRKLEQEHTVLIRMQKTLDSGAEAIAPLLAESTAAREALEAAPRRVTPLPRQAETVGFRRQKQAGAHGRVHGRKGRGESERALIEVVNSLLCQHQEPRSVAEIQGEVMAVRPTTEQTVRNTLDRLVATSKAERTKQGRSVFYSAIRSASENSSGDNDAAQMQAAEVSG